MKIPEKIKVGGITYQVKQVDKIDKSIIGEGFTVGLWEPLDCNIYLVKNANEQAKERYFLHEVIHALFDHCNLKQSEDKVERLSSALYMFIKDNPEIFN